MSKKKIWAAAVCSVVVLAVCLYGAFFVAEMSPLLSVVFWTLAAANLCGSYAFAQYCTDGSYYSKTSWIPAFLLMFALYFAVSLLVTLLPVVHSWWLIGPFVLAVVIHIATNVRTGFPIADVFAVFLGILELILGAVLCGLGVGIYFLVSHFA